MPLRLIGLQNLFPCRLAVPLSREGGLASIDLRDVRVARPKRAWRQPLSNCRRAGEFVERLFAGPYGWGMSSALALAAETTHTEEKRRTIICEQGQFWNTKMFDERRDDLKP